jgi:hypothetical protein
LDSLLYQSHVLSVMKQLTCLVLFLVVLATRSARAATDDPRPEQGPRDRPVVIVMSIVPLVTWVGPKGPRGSEVVSPAERFAITQIVGAGYVVNPTFRFAVVGLFGETLSGLPSGADAWQLGGIAPIAMGTFHHLVVGGGPILAYRSGGTYRVDPGLVVLPGASLPLGSGFALNVVAPVTAVFANRVALSFGVGVGVAKVF